MTHPLVHATLVALAAVTLLGACGRSDDENLWKTDFPKVALATVGDIHGTWEGDVAMGGIRLRIDRERVTLALRCDGAGRKLAQATTTVAFVTTSPARMVLQADLAGGDDACGFRFMKGNEFTYGLRGPGILEIGFAGASVSRLQKLADLAEPR